jgi:hypothetical protein
MRKNNSLATILGLTLAILCGCGPQQYMLRASDGTMIVDAIGQAQGAGMTSQGGNFTPIQGTLVGKWGRNISQSGDPVTFGCSDTSTLNSRKNINGVGYSVSAPGTAGELFITYLNGNIYLIPINIAYFGSGRAQITPNTPATRCVTSMADRTPCINTAYTAPVLVPQNATSYTVTFTTNGNEMTMKTEFDFMCSPRAGSAQTDSTDQYTLKTNI